MTAQTPSQGRHFTVDALKGFAIACVILGHVLLRNVAQPNQNAAYLFLSAFEMPLFMFLSGYVLPGKVRGSRPLWVWRRAVRLMVPFIAWHAIFFATRQFPLAADRDWTAVALGGARYLGKMVAAPTAGLWYLPALLLCSAALALYWPLAERPLLLLAAGWVTFAGMGLARQTLGIEPDYGLLKTITYWPFFAAGFTWGQWGRSLAPTRSVVLWAGIITYPLIAVALMRLMPSMPAAANSVSKIVLGLAGVGFSVALISVLEGAGRLARLDVLGRLTLGVYCSQWLFLRVELGDSVAQIAAGFLLVATASILTTIVIGKIPVARGVLLGEWPARKAAPQPAG